MPTMASSKSHNNAHPLKRSTPRVRKSSNGSLSTKTNGTKAPITRSRSSLDLRNNIEDDEETSGITSLDESDTQNETGHRTIVSPQRRLTRALSGNLGVNADIFPLDNVSPYTNRSRSANPTRRRIGQRTKSPVRNGKASQRAKARILSSIVNVHHDHRSPFPPRKKRITTRLTESPCSSSSQVGTNNSPYNEDEYESTAEEETEFEEHKQTRMGTKRKRRAEEQQPFLKRRRGSNRMSGKKVKGKGKKEEPPDSGATWVSTSTELDDEDPLDEDVDMDQFLLKTSTVSQLHRQRKSSLQRLFSTLPTSNASALSYSMTKDDLIAAIMSSRPSTSRQVESSTDIYISPVVSRSRSPPPTVKKVRMQPSSDAGDLDFSRRKIGRTASTPHRSSEQASAGISRSKSAGDIVRARGGKHDALKQLGVGVRTRSKEKELEGRRELRNGKIVERRRKDAPKERKVTFERASDPDEEDELGTEDEDEDQYLDSQENEDDEEDMIAPPTPIAKRTRAGSGLIQQDSSPNIGSLYISRKRKRVRDIDGSSSEEQEESELGMDVDAEEAEEDPDDEDSEGMTESEDDEVDDDVYDDCEDEEGDLTIRGEIEEELTGRVIRTLRNGKVIVTEDEAEGEEEESEEESDGDEIMEGVDFDMSTATRASLLKLRRDDLVTLCENLNVHTEGTKKQLVSRLLKTRGPRSGSSRRTESSLSSVPTESSTRSPNATPTTKHPKLKRTKTDLLEEIESENKKASQPGILQKNKRMTFSSDKPATPVASDEEGETELNGLDLESLNLLDKEIPPEKLTKLEKIGSGGFKDVYKGRYKRYSVAIADIRGHLTEMDIKELSLLRDLNHPNIVRFIGVSIPEDPKDVPCMIVTELCSNGDLYDYIRNVSAPSLEKVLSIMLDIARGLEYLHTRTPSIIHRDLKSSNVLITNRGVGKINDFGLARVKNSTRSMVKSLVGTVNWQAPELWVPHPRYNEKVDVYSAGLVFWEMLQWHLPTKKYPFEGSNEHAIYNDVGKNKMRPSIKGMRSQWGSDILDLIDEMWDQEPANRPHISEVVPRLEELYLAARKSKR